MSKIERLRLVESEPDKDLVETLEDLLAKAKSGQIKAIAFAMVEGGGYIGTGWTWPGNVSGHELLSAVTVLNHRYLKRFNNGGGE